MDPTTLTASMSHETFSEIMAVSPRQVREVLYSQFGIKSKSKSLLKNLQQKKQERINKLHECLKNCKSKKEVELCNELIRNWLYTKRSMLKSALDFLGVPNDNGLIDTEPTLFTELSEEKAKSLFEHLTADYPKEHVYIYLRFMQTPLVKID